MARIRIEGRDYVVEIPKRISWNRDKRSFVTSASVSVENDKSYLSCYLTLVPTRKTEENICLKHVCRCRITGKVIETRGERILVLVDVLPCEYCDNLDRWDQRIKEWRKNNESEYTKSVFADCPEGLRPSEWALQISSNSWNLSQLGWDLEEMNQFLEGEVDFPPRYYIHKIPGEDISGLAGFIAGSRD